MFNGLVDRPLGLAQHAGVDGGRCVGQREAERLRHERVRRLAEGERPGLAGGAHDAARGAGEADEVLAVAALRAGGQLRRQAGGDEQLEPERELVGGRGVAGRVGVEQRELVAEQVVDGRVRVSPLEQAPDGVAGAGGGVQRGGVSRSRG